MNVKTAEKNIRHYYEAVDHSTTVDEATGKFDVNTNDLGEITQSFARYVPDVKTDDCVTITVEGRFCGARCAVDSQTHHVEQATVGSLPFKDYWVLSNDRVIYRYSDIKRQNQRECY